MVTRKSEYKDVDGTPQKRVFLSIINDYDLITGLCELIDNAIDMWVLSDQKSALEIEISLDSSRQLISVQDNAGGVSEANVEYLVSPGASGFAATNESIGVFGVGGKRAGVALGELVEIKTRYKRQKSLQLDITKEWLASDDWKVKVYEIPHIRQGSTLIEISKLRRSFDDAAIDEIRVRLGETYARFLDSNCTIKLNAIEIRPTTFDIWAFPPGFGPRSIELDVWPTESGNVTAKITGGLIQNRDPERENYGVYVYCNNRLILKELRSRDVGYFITSEAGVPHPDASLCRVIVELNGNPALMPWNSSKNGVNFGHYVFQYLRPSLIDMVSFYTKLSRRLKADWEGAVFQYKAGELEKVAASEVRPSGKLVMPQLPRVRALPFVDDLKSQNRKLTEDQPWTLGLIETIGIVDNITRQNLDTKNRSALVLLDSNLEVALKEFIVSRDDLFPKRQYPDSRIRDLFQSRNSVINEVKAHVAFSTTQLRKISHYYELRNKLIHERATVGITDNQVSDYRRLVEQIMNKLFGVKFPKRESYT